MGIVGRLAGELDFKIGIDGSGCGCRLRQLGAYDHHRKLPATGSLQHVQVAIAVAGIEGFDRRGNQEVALSSVADALAFGSLTDAIDLMHRVRHVITQRGLDKDPLTVGLTKRGEGEKKKSNQNSSVRNQDSLHGCSQNFQWIGHDTATMDAPYAATVVHAT